MGAFNLQARLRLVIYAAAMSSAEAAIALFAEQDIGANAASFCGAIPGDSS